MEFGAHLPLIVTGDHPPTAKDLVDYAVAAENLNYRFLSANDHVVFRSGWLDGLTCLAAVCAATRRLRLATTILIPALRHPVVAAKMLATLDRLSGGRLLVGVGAGSYPPDYAACGIPFEERWARLDESIHILRALWCGESRRRPGRFYSVPDVRIEPLPAQQPGPPIWIASWGSPAGLRRAARLGDGWLASAYNTTPDKFAADWQQVRELAAKFGKRGDRFGNAVVTMFSYVTEDAAEADRVARTVLQPALNRPADELVRLLPIGAAQLCAEKIARLAEAGVQRIFIWPVADAERQLRVFADKVMARV